MLYFGFNCGLDLGGSSGDMMLFSVVWVFAVSLGFEWLFCGWVECLVLVWVIGC